MIARPLNKLMGTLTMTIKPWIFLIPMLMTVFLIPTPMLAWRMTR